MLYNDIERAMMAHALQPNMRKGDISPASLEIIVADFGLRLAPGLRLLDIGPGQCDLLDIARRAGCATVGCDFDPAVVELGRLRGHEMHHADLRQGLPVEIGRVDAVFCRGSLNAYWFLRTPARLATLLEGIAAALGDGGWMWIAPWNNPTGGVLPEPDPVREIVDAWLARHGIASVEPRADRKAKYGVGYGIPRHELWLRGTATP